ncbi:hypothetical protein C8J57DRAFT_1463550 [Mycena rebaudengoi]|nr:hypothetical protein C8J57DRAFT_1463550 [Mycena rebaudengoi]
MSQYYSVGGVCRPEQEMGLQVPSPLQLEDLERRTADARLDPYYPVLTLPPEIASDIFQCCLPVGRICPLSTEAPLVLLAICRTWRSIALATPALWNHLFLNIDEGQQHWALRVPERLEEFIGTWFGRALALPLSLGIFGDPEGEGTEDVLNAILRRHAPQLQSLELHLISPQLQSLSLTALAPSALVLPWDQLATFSAREVGTAGCLDLLRRAPSLRELSSWGDDLDAHHLAPCTAYTHSGLVSLRLSNARSEHIMLYLTCPALQHLSLQHLSLRQLSLAIFRTTTTTQPSLPFLSSIASLRTFSFGDPTRTVSVSWFHHMQDLTSFKLCSPGKWRGFTQKLLLSLNRAHQRDFLPKLQNLTFLEWGSQEFHYVDEPLMVALRSRSDEEDGLATLQSFRLIWPISELVERHSVVREDELRELVGRGMKIHVGTDYINYLQL